MSAIDSLAAKVKNIREAIAYNEELLEEMEDVEQTTAVYGIFTGGGVVVDGERHGAVLASKDVFLKDGCGVWCLPMENGGMAIIGGGAD